MAAKRFGVQATITKAMVAPLAAHIGLANSDRVVTPDGTWEPGTLMFQGFQGRLHVADGLYHGMLWFVTVKPGAEGRVSFKTLVDGATKLDGTAVAVGAADDEPGGSAAGEETD